jgi:hypothetical protein
MVCRDSCKADSHRGERARMIGTDGVVGRDSRVAIKSAEDIDHDIRATLRSLPRVIDS